MVGVLVVSRTRKVRFGTAALFPDAALANLVPLIGSSLSKITITDHGGDEVLIALSQSSSAENLTEMKLLRGQYSVASNHAWAVFLRLRKLELQVNRRIRASTISEIGKIPSLERLKLRSVVDATKEKVAALFAPGAFPSLKRLYFKVESYFKLDADHFLEHLKACDRREEFEVLDITCTEIEAHLESLLQICPNARLRNWQADSKASFFNAALKRIRSLTTDWLPSRDMASATPHLRSLDLGHSLALYADFAPPPKLRHIAYAATPRLWIEDGVVLPQIESVSLSSESAVDLDVLKANLQAIARAFPNVRELYLQRPIFPDPEALAMMFSLPRLRRVGGPIVSKVGATPHFVLSHPVLQRLNFHALKSVVVDPGVLPSCSSLRLDIAANPSEPDVTRLPSLRDLRLSDDPPHRGEADDWFRRVLSVANGAAVLSRLTSFDSTWPTISEHKLNFLRQCRSLRKMDGEFAAEPVLQAMSDGCFPFLSAVTLQLPRRDPNLSLLRSQTIGHLMIEAVPQHEPEVGIPPISLRLSRETLPNLQVLAFGLDGLSINLSIENLPHLKSVKLHTLLDLELRVSDCPSLSEFSIAVSRLKFLCFSGWAQDGVQITLYGPNTTLAGFAENSSNQVRFDSLRAFRPSDPSVDPHLRLLMDTLDPAGNAR